MVISMREITSTIRKMGMGFIYGKVGINMLDSLRMIIGMAMEKCIGEMALHIRENGQMGSK